MILTATIVYAVFAQKEVRIEVLGGRFERAAVRIPAGATLRLVNRDGAIYTIESPGAFAGDVMLEGHAEAVVKLQRGGSFVAMIEERPDSEVRLDVEPDPNAPPPTDPPFDLARANGLQPLDAEGREPAYGAVTQFDLAVKGQEARQQVLMDLFRLQEELSGDRPPAEFALYFSAREWADLRSSVAMVTGLGFSAYDRVRFGSAVAATRPKPLHLVPKLRLPGVDAGQRDVFVRVTGDSAWFNLRVCRLIWRRLGGRIVRKKLEWGYAGPNGRSPILGGFYDGTGNPSGPARTKAVYGADRTATLAIYRIRFDEDAFLAQPQAYQEAVIGRERTSGRPQRRPSETAHKVRANDGQNTIVRMPLIFDEGAQGTGLLFIAAQHTFEPLEKLLARMTGGAPDRLLKYMRFESAAYYAIPPSPKGGYPGSLRKSAFTFGS